MDTFNYKFFYIGLAWKFFQIFPYTVMEKANKLFGQPDSYYSTLVGKFGEGNGTPLQYACLEDPMDAGAW